MCKVPAVAHGCGHPYIDINHMHETQFCPQGIAEGDVCSKMQYVFKNDINNPIPLSCLNCLELKAIGASTYTEALRLTLAEAKALSAKNPQWKN